MQEQENDNVYLTVIIAYPSIGMDCTILMFMLGTIKLKC